MGSSPAAKVVAVLMVSAALILAWARPSASQSAEKAMGASAAPAGSPPQYSDYEARALSDATRQLDTSVDLQPEGKRVEGIDVIRLPVIDPHDPVPDWLNWFHVTSREDVIRREVLLAPGSRYRQDRCNETARNLRALDSQVSLVLCTATRGKDGDSVRVLVVTKDVWSLMRLSWNIVGTNAGLEYLLLAPSETNLLGTHQTLRASYEYRPLSHGFGFSYIVPRISDTRLAFAAGMTAYFNRSSGDLEGTTGGLQAAQPLYATFVPSAWQSQLAWYDGQQRVYRGVNLKRDVNGIPIEYHRRQVIESAGYIWSFGSSRKHDITAGGEMNIRDYRATNTTGASQANFAAFVARYVPVSETRVGPYLQYRTYSTEFTRTWDSETLGLEENYRLGADFHFRLYPVARALGSTHDMLGTYAALFYSQKLGEGFLRAGVESTIEPSPERIENGAIEARLHIASPRIGGAGRLVFDAEVLDRYRNGLNRISYLGGDGRLRGYPTNAFSGQNAYVGNLEFRSRPIQIFSLQIGGVAFYDVGNVIDDWSVLAPRSSVGAGVRVLAPQFDRGVLRIDVSTPLNRDPWPRTADQPYGPIAVILTVYQAFSMPQASGTVGAPSSATALGPTTGWLGQ